MGESDLDPDLSHCNLPPGELVRAGFIGILQSFC